MHATEYLRGPGSHKLGPVVALAGTERFLKLAALQEITRTVIGPRGDDLSVSHYGGGNLEWKTVADALLTNSMWSPVQVVVVDDADEFVSEQRSHFEKYVDKPAKKSVLVLDVKSFPATTNLAKKVAKVGLILECSQLKPPAMIAWVTERAKVHYQKTLERGAGPLLVELIGTEFGLLDQELAKLTAYAGQAETITTASVEKLVGGWKAETTWKMTDALRDGNFAHAMDLLDKLLISGEAPLKLLGGVAFVFRPVGRAQELIGQGQGVGEALATAGVKPFSLGGMTAYVNRVGRPRCERINGWLLEADMDLKGSGTALPDRVILERLFFRLAAPKPVAPRPAR